MSHKPLYVGLGVATVISVLLAVLAFRPSPAFPREAPLVKSIPSNVDEWPAK
jgi:hypothetical protein